jgi:hypothetical protein
VRKIIALLILLGGISMLSGLWPLPSHLANEFRNDAVAQLTTPPSADSSPELEQSSKDFYQEIVNDPNLEMKFWFHWFTNLALIACCVLSGYLMLMQTHIWGVSVLITTVFYAGITGFFYPLYGILIHNTTSLTGILSRFSILAKYPLSLFYIMWFNAVIPVIFIIGSFMAIKSIVAQDKVHPNSSFKRDA